MYPGSGAGSTEDGADHGAQERPQGRIADEAGATAPVRRTLCWVPGEPAYFPGGAGGSCHAPEVTRACSSLLPRYRSPSPPSLTGKALHPIQLWYSSLQCMAPRHSLCLRGDIPLRASSRKGGGAGMHMCILRRSLSEIVNIRKGVAPAPIVDSRRHPLGLLTRASAPPSVACTYGACSKPTGSGGRQRRPRPSSAHRSMPFPGVRLLSLHQMRSDGRPRWSWRTCFRVRSGLPASSLLSG